MIQRNVKYQKLHKNQKLHTVSKKNILFITFLANIIVGWKYEHDNTEIKCKLRVQNMVKLYMKVRFFHALKCSNAYNIDDKSVKRNRKILKLRHL